MTAQVGGTHYGEAEYQLWDYIVDADLGFDLGNCTKYLGRAHKKGNEVEDLRKAKSYYDKWCSRQNREQSQTLSEDARYFLNAYIKNNPTPVSAHQALIAVLEASQNSSNKAKEYIDFCIQNALNYPSGGDR